MTKENAVEAAIGDWLVNSGAWYDGGRLTCLCLDTMEEFYV